MTACISEPLTGTVAITGTPYVGQTLGVNVTNLMGTGTLFFEWRADGIIIGRDSTLRLLSAQAGSTVTVTVSTSNNFGSVTSPAVGPINGGDELLPKLAGSVSIIGIPQVGQALGVNTANLVGNGTFSYEWRVGGIPVATTETLLLASAYMGSTVTVSVATSDNYGSLTSRPVGPISAAGLPQLTGSVSIVGIPQVGQTLGVNTASIIGNGIMLFEWKVGGNVVGTESTLPLIAAHAGMTVTVSVTLTGNSGSVTSMPFGPVTAGAGTAPLTGSIGITGIPQMGQTLGVNTASLGGTGTTFFEWKVGGSVVGTSGMLTLLADDVGRSVTVTVTRSGNSGSITSPPVGPVTTTGLPQLTGSVSITGTPQVGQTLGVNTISLGGSGTISYEWRVDGTEVGTGNTLPLLAVDVGHTVTVTVRRTGNSGSVTSHAVGPVTPIGPAQPIYITIAGIPARYNGHWGFLDMMTPLGVVAISLYVEIGGSTVTFAMYSPCGERFNTPGTYRFFFGIDNPSWDPVADYYISARPITAGHNDVPFSAFIQPFGFAEPLEAMDSGARFRPDRSQTGADR